MIITQALEQRSGPKQRIGAFTVTPDKRTGIFAGYTKCEHCKGDLKVIVPMSNARTLMAMFYGEQHPKLKVRVARRLQKIIDGDIMRSATEKGDM